MMNAMKNIVKISYELRIGKITFRMEDESMKAILGQSEEEETRDCS